MSLQLAPYRDLLETLAARSAAVIRPYFANPDLDVEFKADESPVTCADRDAEAVMRELITEAFPTHGIIGEEYGNSNEDAEFVWVLDPIDGTISFTSGCPLFGTLIGLLHEGQPVLGAIHQPTIGQLCIGDNETTTMNGQPVRVRETSALDQALLLTTDLKNVDAYKARAPFEKLISACGLFRGWGDCYGYLLVAGGHADIMIDPIVNPWDVLPVLPVVRGAGAVVSTWEGKDPVSGNSCVAATPGLHRQVIEMLNA